ncbi:hypothetical protein I6H48_00115 [Corynebacterium amycolatum]|uniref:Uncharacterized protein n=1 Tax=Corynebacterium amycolatum TaxID=43765 RepID=A0AB37G9Q3_CORAY|nr:MULTISPECIES: hypothetical protein [Corynebacterium]MCQ9125520.1 hypothetical protein [Corynebacterium amycolatum]MCQ9167244.1 hypothetical protein [Corynebacterium amycolatum]MCQ9170167.1 hypothetical protein [Corynebacterium amycolatum]MCQ9174276.1 hypothetical protein [Corynebacterium amycolatum]MCQ9176924.1 hypothetical protein [Corynebacterium amycolatum]
MPVASIPKLDGLVARRVPERRVDDFVDVVELGGRLDHLGENEARQIRGQAQVFGIAVGRRSRTRRNGRQPRRGPDTPRATARVSSALSRPDCATAAERDQ